MDLNGVKGHYLREQLERGIRDILESQRLIASNRIYQAEGDRIREYGSGRGVRGRSGKLMEALTHPQYSVRVSGEGVIAETTLPVYIRFLDMKRHGNWRIYNRQIWGILYRDTLQSVKYEFRDWLRDRFPELLNVFNKE